MTINSLMSEDVKTVKIFVKPKDHKEDKVEEALRLVGRR